MRILIRLMPLLAAVPLLSAAAGPDRNAQARAAMQSSFKAHGQAGMERLDQDATQALCSRYAPGMPPGEDAARAMAANRASIRYPADGNFLGDWKRGEAIAQEGTGKQYSDDPGKPSGGNCYACHRLSGDEVAYGTIGPSLYQFGKNRGRSEEMLKLTWSMIYDMKAFTLCSAMPRFGSRGILDEQQIKDVMALLFDPDSPVNR
ncbi:MAG: sulfur oxidation c-type cytochrome SoxX [Mizugakiibacter sp.]|uniref:sulfur oxidation c-type cytochrome SoxX n=1 Tax=Mizugakiibacter sp. TaxID=1972610 RepID=UPI0031BEEA1C|nr:sulfur oxidation c-type cytochrome SoxX [Xanthomonadaceae bacterium]